MTRPPPSHILIVDDEAAIREYCQRTLALPDYHVDLAANGDEALQRLTSVSYDIIVTDVVMTGSLNGVALQEEIKRRAPTTDVIIMTSFPDLETAIPTLKGGAYDYLCKPLESSFLRLVIQRCLEKRSLREELNNEKQLRQDLEVAYAQLQDMQQVKEAFLSRVRHELRTPLTPAFLALECLAKAQTDPAQQELCAGLRGRLESVQSTIENLLLFTSLKDPSTEHEKRITPVRVLLEDLITHLAPLWREKDLFIDVQFETRAASLRVNPSLIQNAFRHLLTNAIQFNKKSGVIRIEGKVTPSGVHIAFSDTGIGIPREKLSKVFDTFYQVAGYLTREVGGLGLGLSVVRRIADLHGGSVLVQSEEGHGSTFTLALPLETLADDAFRDQLTSSVNIKH